MRRLISQLFSGASRRILTVKDGPSGLRAALNNKIDLVLVDASAPDLRALEVVNAIKGQKPDLPIIVAARDGAADVVERAVIFCGATTVRPEHIAAKRAPSTRQSQTSKSDDIPITTSLRDLEKYHIERVLRHKSWNQSAAAVVLGIDRKTLHSKMREFHLKQKPE